MNEQIKEIIEKTVKTTLLEFSTEYVTVSIESEELGVKTVQRIPIEFCERFAELIVRECIEKITNYNLIPGHSAKWEDIYDIHARLLQDLGEELKEHFGVK